MKRVGIVGVGGMGGNHARHYSKMPDVELFFFEIDKDRAASFRERFSASQVDTFDHLVNQCDYIDICLPTGLHAEYAVKSLSAGRATLVEKPLARTLEEGTAMIEAANKAGVVLMPGHVVRFFAEFKAAHDVVERGGIGTPAAARMRRGGGTPKGAGLWFQDHAKSGGVLIDLAVHDFDWLRWTLGEVKCVYSRSVGIQTGTGPDYALTTMTFDSGAVGHVESTWMDPSGFRTTIEVAGSGGIIQYDSRENQALRTVTANGTQVDNNLDPLDDPYYKELLGFLNSTETGTPPVTAYDGWMALSIATAAVESAKTGKVIVPSRG